MTGTFSYRKQTDIDKINNMISNVIGIDEVGIMKTILFGVKGHSRTTKPRLILATMDTPTRKQAILALTKSLRDTEDWKTIYISPDPNPKEREEGRRSREAIKERRLDGVVGIGIRRNKIVKIVNCTQQTEVQLNNQTPYQDNSATETSRRLE